MVTKVLFSFVCAFLALFGTVHSDCNTCSAISSAVCINATAFHICHDGVTPSAKIERCPGTTVCTDTKGVCQANVAGVVLGCDNDQAQCGYCTPSDRFTCVGVSQYAMCTDDGELGYIGTCDTGKICSLASEAEVSSICNVDCLYAPTCQNNETITQAPPVQDWKDSCIDKAVGYYKNIYDSTCSTYVYCENTANGMMSVKYTCGAGTYFDDESRKCVKSKPSHCI